MNELTTVIDRLAGDRDVVFEFFATFSRFEYAVKRAGYLKASQQAEPDWDRFANSIKGSFARLSEQVSAAVVYLESDPPKKQVSVQVNQQYRLDWRDTSRGDGESYERFIIRLVTTIRNNLFHGGKYPPPLGPQSDVARNRKLLKSGLAVIKHLLEASGDVRGEYLQVA
jgi:hypothetical protein